MTGKLGRAWVGARVVHGFVMVECNTTPTTSSPSPPRPPPTPKSNLTNPDGQYTMHTNPCTNHALTHAWHSLPVNPNPILTPPNLGTLRLHDTAATVNCFPSLLDNSICSVVFLWFTQTSFQIKFKYSPIKTYDGDILDTNKTGLD